MPDSINVFGASAKGRMTPNMFANESVDIEDALSLIDANNGNGEWEENSTPTVDRWLFPRFAGADEIGTCSAKTTAKNTAHVGIHKSTAKCVDFAPDMGNMYLSRSGLGDHDTDVEMICSWLDAPRNMVGAVLLLGDPGCGKTALVEAAATRAEREVTTVVCTPDHTKDSLYLRFMGEGRGEDGSPYALGPIPYAAKHGHLLYMDEVMLLVDGLKPLLYPLADGRAFLPEGNVDGSALEIHPDFRLILSSNPLVRGASLPEPIGSRCASTTVTIETHADMLRDLGIDDAVIAAWSALGTQNLWRPQIREMRLADYWLDENPAQAVSAFLGEHCPESQRNSIREQVVAVLGGDIRADGRLVVS